MPDEGGRATLGLPCQGGLEAVEWHSRGRRFDPDQRHQFPRIRSSVGGADRSRWQQRAAAKRSRARGAAIVAPPEWWPDPEIGRRLLELDRAFVAAGGRLGVGSDPGNTGFIAGYANHRALELLGELGWEPLEVIRLTTSNNAEILGVVDGVGRIAVGYLADLMVVPNDPLVDIRALEGVVLVFKDGVGYRPEGLKASVRGQVEWH